MSHVIYRMNTHEYFTGYDVLSGDALWSPAHKEEALIFPDSSAAESECFQLTLRGFFVTTAKSVKEHLKDEW